MADGDRKTRYRNPVSFEPSEDVGLQFFLKSDAQRNKKGRFCTSLVVTNESPDLVRASACACVRA